MFPSYFQITTKRIIAKMIQHQSKTINMVHDIPSCIHLSTAKDKILVKRSYQNWKTEGEYQDAVNPSATHYKVLYGCQTVLHSATIEPGDHWVDHIATVIHIRSTEGCHDARYVSPNAAPPNCFYHFDKADLLVDKPLVT